MIILVINAGSTSVKFKLYDMAGEAVIAEGNCQKVGREDAELKYTGRNGEKTKLTLPMQTHRDALSAIVEMLTAGETKVIDSWSDIAAVAHRVSFGGKYPSTVLADAGVIEYIEEMGPVAPLHNPPQARVMRDCLRIFGENTIMAAGFDTAFNSTIPPVAHLYAVPYEYYENHNFRRYGYHGLSYQFVVARYAELAKKSLDGTKIVACHLGGGSSVCAVKDGKSVDNTFGMGTGQGPACGTRAGTVDHAGLGYLMRKENLSYDEIESILHRESGLLGLSGISADEKEIEEAACFGNARAQLTLDYMAYQIKGYIGSYAFNMGGVDTIIFTGGIGENSDCMRAKICENLEAFGAVLDLDANKTFNRQEHKISAEASKVEIWTIPTNEELVIARDTLKLVSGKDKTNGI